MEKEKYVYDPYVFHLSEIENVLINIAAEQYQQENKQSKKELAVSKERIAHELEAYVSNNPQQIDLDLLIEYCNSRKEHYDKILSSIRYNKGDFYKDYRRVQQVHLYATSALEDVIKENNFEGSGSEKKQPLK